MVSRLVTSPFFAFATVIRVSTSSEYAVTSWAYFSIACLSTPTAACSWSKYVLTSAGDAVVGGFGITVSVGGGVGGFSTSTDSDGKSVNAIPEPQKTKIIAITNAATSAILIQSLSIVGLSIVRGTQLLNSP